MEPLHHLEVSVLSRPIDSIRQRIASSLVMRAQELDSFSVATGDGKLNTVL